MKKQCLFKYRLFSAVFDTRQSKYDVIEVIEVIVTVSKVLHQDNSLLILSSSFISFHSVVTSLGS